MRRGTTPTLTFTTPYAADLIQGAEDQQQTDAAISTR